MSPFTMLLASLGTIGLVVPKFKKHENGKMVTQVGNIPNPSCISVSAARFYNNSLMENFEF